MIPRLPTLLALTLATAFACACESSQIAGTKDAKKPQSPTPPEEDLEVVTPVRLQFVRTFAQVTLPKTVLAEGESTSTAPKLRAACYVRNSIRLAKQSSESNTVDLCYVERTLGSLKGSFAYFEPANEKYLAWAVKFDRLSKTTARLVVCSAGTPYYRVDFDDISESGARGKAMWDRRPFGESNRGSITFDSGATRKGLIAFERSMETVLDNSPENIAAQVAGKVQLGFEASSMENGVYEYQYFGRLAEDAKNHGGYVARFGDKLGRIAFDAMSGTIMRTLDTTGRVIAEDAAEGADALKPPLRVLADELPRALSSRFSLPGPNFGEWDCNATEQLEGKDEDYLACQPSPAQLEDCVNGPYAD